MAFTLSIYPWLHKARYTGEGWVEEFIEQEHLRPEEEAALGREEWAALAARRNSLPGLPMVNYTTQYGLGCFEGIKAFPQPDGSLKLFRPQRNCARMAFSMEGLRMPPIDESDSSGGNDRNGKAK